MSTSNEVINAPCRCGKGIVYIGKWGEKLNPRIDNVSVCEECFVKYLQERYFKKEEK